MLLAKHFNLVKLLYSLERLKQCTHKGNNKSETTVLTKTELEQKNCSFSEKLEQYTKLLLPHKNVSIA